MADNLKDLALTRETDPPVTVNEVNGSLLSSTETSQIRDVAPQQATENRTADKTGYILSSRELENSQKTYLKTEDTDVLNVFVKQNTENDFVSINVSNPPNPIERQEEHRIGQKPPGFELFQQRMIELDTLKPIPMDVEFEDDKVNQRKQYIAQKPESIVKPRPLNETRVEEKSNISSDPINKVNSGKMEYIGDSFDRTYSVSIQTTPAQTDVVTRDIEVQIEKLEWFQKLTDEKLIAMLELEISEVASLKNKCRNEINLFLLSASVAVENRIVKLKEKLGYNLSRSINTIFDESKSINVYSQKNHKDIIYNNDIYGYYSVLAEEESKNTLAWNLLNFRLQSDDIVYPLELSTSLGSYSRAEFVIINDVVSNLLVKKDVQWYCLDLDKLILKYSSKTIRAKKVYARNVTHTEERDDKMRINKTYSYVQKRNVQGASEDQIKKLKKNDSAVESKNIYSALRKENYSRFFGRILAKYDYKLLGDFTANMNWFKNNWSFLKVEVINNMKLLDCQDPYYQSDVCALFMAWFLRSVVNRLVRRMGWNIASKMLLSDIKAREIYNKLYACLRNNIDQKVIENIDIISILGNLYSINRMLCTRLNDFSNFNFIVKEQLNSKTIWLDSFFRSILGDHYDLNDSGRLQALAEAWNKIMHSLVGNIDNNVVYELNNSSLPGNLIEDQMTSIQPEIEIKEKNDVKDSILVAEQAPAISDLVKVSWLDNQLPAPVDNFDKLALVHDWVAFSVPDGPLGVLNDRLFSQGLGFVKDGSLSDEIKAYLFSLPFDKGALSDDELNRLLKETNIEKALGYAGLSLKDYGFEDKRFEYTPLTFKDALTVNKDYNSGRLNYWSSKYDPRSIGLLSYGNYVGPSRFGGKTELFGNIDLKNVEPYTKENINDIIGNDKKDNQTTYGVLLNIGRRNFALNVKDYDDLLFNINKIDKVVYDNIQNGSAWLGSNGRPLFSGKSLDGNFNIQVNGKLKGGTLPRSLTKLNLSFVKEVDPFLLASIGLKETPFDNEYNLAPIMKALVRMVEINYDKEAPINSNNVNMDLGKYMEMMIISPLFTLRNIMCPVTSWMRGDTGAITRMRPKFDVTCMQLNSIGVVGAAFAAGGDILSGGMISPKKIDKERLEPIGKLLQNLEEMKGTGTASLASRGAGVFWDNNLYQTLIAYSGLFRINTIVNSTSTGFNVSNVATAVSTEFFYVYLFLEGLRYTFWYAPHRNIGLNLNVLSRTGNAYTVGNDFLRGGIGVQRVAWNPAGGGGVSFMYCTTTQFVNWLLALNGGAVVGWADIKDEVNTKFIVLPNVQPACPEFLAAWVLAHFGTGGDNEIQQGQILSSAGVAIREAFFDQSIFLDGFWTSQNAMAAWGVTSVVLIAPWLMGNITNLAPIRLTKTRSDWMVNNVFGGVALATVMPAAWTGGKWVSDELDRVWDASINVVGFTKLDIVNAKKKIAILFHKNFEPGGTVADNGAANGRINALCMPGQPALGGFNLFPYGGGGGHINQYRHRLNGNNSTIAMPVGGNNQSLGASCRSYNMFAMLFIFMGQAKFHMELTEEENKIYESMGSKRDYKLMSQLNDIYVIAQYTAEIRKVLYGNLGLATLHYNASTLPGNQVILNSSMPTIEAAIAVLMGLSDKWLAARVITQRVNWAPVSVAHCLLDPAHPYVFDVLFRKDDKSVCNFDPFSQVDFHKKVDVYDLFQLPFRGTLGNLAITLGDPIRVEDRMDWTPLRFLASIGYFNLAGGLVHIVTTAAGMLSGLSLVSNVGDFVTPGLQGELCDGPTDFKFGIPVYPKRYLMITGTLINVGVANLTPRMAAILAGGRFTADLANYFLMDDKPVKLTSVSRVVVTQTLSDFLTDDVTPSKVEKPKIEEVKDDKVK